MKYWTLIIGLLLIPVYSWASCESVAAASSGGWQPVATAPRDGTTVEMLETYGVAPWYGLFKWTKTMTYGGPNGFQSCDGAPSPYEQLADYWKKHPWQAWYYGKNTIPDWFHFNQRWNEWTLKHCHDQPVSTYEMSTPEWVSVQGGGQSVSEGDCLFWRPYNGDTQHYDDPTHGAQNTVAYECAYLHMRYDKEGDRCVQ